MARRSGPRLDGTKARAPGDVFYPIARSSSRPSTMGCVALLVLEDDAYPVENFSSLAREFIGKVPHNWDGLMLGAEHLRPPEMIRPGVRALRGFQSQPCLRRARAADGGSFPILAEYHERSL